MWFIFFQTETLLYYLTLVTKSRIMSLTSRRDVIKTLALGTGGLILSPKILRSTDLFKKDRLGIALVGLGYYSTDLLAPALQQTKNCYLAGIVTGTPSKAETWKAKHNIPDKNIYNYQILTRSPTTMILMLCM